MTSTMAASSVRSAFADQGFVVLRDAIPPDVIEELRNALVALGEHLPTTELRRAAYEIDSFHRLCEAPVVHEAVSVVLNVPAVFSHPRRFVRLVNADRSTWSPPHQDHYYVGGTKRTVTVWVPLTPVAPRAGSLFIDCVPPRALRRHVPTTGFTLPRRSVGPFAWRSPTLAPGDVLLLGALTVHATGPVTTCDAASAVDDRYRISVDFRVQPSADPILASNTWAPFEADANWMSRYGIALPAETPVSDAPAPISAEEP